MPTAHVTPEHSPADAGRERRLVWYLGPALVAAIAYVDPGNVAANVSAGADHHYLLVWVLVVANLMAVLVQYLSAKLGLVTGRSLPELLGERMARGRRRLYWAQAEVVAAATDLAEVVGGAIALRILFGLPLLVGGLIIGVVSTVLLMTQSRGQRTFEFLVTALLAVITFGFLAGLFLSPVRWSGVLGGLEPRFAGTDTVMLAASMLGATVMPHAIYVHSALARDRHGHASDPRRVRRLLAATRLDVVLALAVAGTVNIAMLVIAAASLSGASGTDSIDGAHRAITDALGPVIGAMFAVGLLASGLASTSVGCYAGSTVMEGLLHVRVPLLARRVVVIVPALAIMAAGFDPTQSLVVSQVVLSLGVPFALVPLTLYTSRRTLMGTFTNGRIVTSTSWLVTVLIVALNLALVGLTVVELT